MVVPAGFDDPANPSGGNGYDQRLCAGLAGLGWDVTTHTVAGRWPDPDTAALAALQRALASLHDTSTVLVDGLVGCLAPQVMVPASRRLRVALLVHLPFGLAADDARLREAESAVLSSAAAVVTTSAWIRDLLLSAYPLDPARVHVARPGVDGAPLARGLEDAAGLLCVAAVARHKGHDLLVSALARVPTRTWSCRCVGPLDREPEFVAEVRRDVKEAGIEEQVGFTGPLSGDDLDRAYDAAGVLLVPSRFESYGMVVLEALARGLPVIAFAVGGLPEAMGVTPGGRVPGILVAPEDPDALLLAIAQWLEDRDLRAFLRDAASERRATLAGWDTTTDAVVRAVRQPG